MSSVAEPERQGIHAANVSVKQVLDIGALAPQLGVKVDAACVMDSGRETEDQSSKGHQGWRDDEQQLGPQRSNRGALHICSEGIAEDEAG